MPPRDEDMDDTSHDEELEEEGESEEGEDDSPDDDFDLESDESLIEDGDFDEERGEDDEVAVVRTPAKRRTTLRHVPMIEGVPKAKLERAEFAKEVWGKLDDKYRLEKPTRYLISGAYETHQPIDHSKFGVGYVTEVLGTNKIEVIFQDSLRKLVQRR